MRSFTEGSVSTLKVFLDRCPHLTHFDLSLNTFGYAQPNNIECSKEGIDVLFSSMDGHQPCHIHTLDLSCLHITDASLVSLLNCKFAQTSLIRLYLRSNNLTDCAATCIAQSLPCMLKLEVLSLAGNAIGDQGAAAIAFGFDQLAVLQTLDLDENEVCCSCYIDSFILLCCRSSRLVKTVCLQFITRYVGSTQCFLFASCIWVGTRRPHPEMRW